MKGSARGGMRGRKVEREDEGEEKRRDANG